jgi:acyl dehydratase
MATPSLETVLSLETVKVGDTLPEFSYDVTPTTIILGALAARDWRPMHHDKDFAINRNGARDIFLNTPNQAAWFEKYLTDWSGPKGRLGKIKFRMKSSVYPGDTMVFKGQVKGLETDDSGCGWADLEVNLTVGDKTVTDCFVKIALPVNADDNPWKRKGDDWRP